MNTPRPAARILWQMLVPAIFVLLDGVLTSRSGSLCSSRRPHPLCTPSPNLIDGMLDDGPHELLMRDFCEQCSAPFGLQHRLSHQFDPRAAFLARIFV